MKVTMCFMIQSNFPSLTPLLTLISPFVEFVKPNKFEAELPNLPGMRERRKSETPNKKIKMRQFMLEEMKNEAQINRHVVKKG